MFKPDKAFVLAAGKGTRMQPYTKDKPKPMVEVGGKPLIDRTFDLLVADGIKHAVVNLHYFGNILEQHLAKRKDVTIAFSKEAVLLDTGGGVRKGARVLGDEPFYVLSGDGFWTDGPDKTALQRMAEKWDEDKMDILLLLQPVDRMILTKPVGDYDIDDDGRASRSHDKKGKYMFTSMRIMRPQAFRGTPEGPFSYLQMMDKAEEQGRLYAVIHDGAWEHISTPEDLDAVNAEIQKKGHG